MLRFIAALMIIISHSYEWWCGKWGFPGFMSHNTHTELSSLGKHLDAGIRNFNFGVDVFFLVIGFLITYILLAEKGTFGKINIPKFYVRRILRIWPLYFLIIAITPVYVNWLSITPPDYWSNLLFWNNFHAISTQQWTFPVAHLWSICIEEHFYLVWPIIIAFVPTKKLPPVFVAIIAASIFYRAYTFMNSDNSWFIIYLHTLSRCDVLCIGALAAYVHYHNPIKISVNLWVRLVIYAVFIYMFFTDNVNNYENLFLATIKKYFYTGVAGFAMLNYMFNAQAKLSFKKRNALHYFGKVSYGIYMYGVFVLGIVFHKIMSHYEFPNMYLYFSLIIAGSLLIPAISYEIFEKFFLRLKRKFEIVDAGR